MELNSISYLHTATGTATDGGESMTGFDLILMLRNCAFNFGGGFFCKPLNETLHADIYDSALTVKW